MHSKRHLFTAFVVLPALACTQGSASSSRDPGSAPLAVTLLDGSELTGHPALLKVSFLDPKAPQIEISIAAQSKDGTDRWSAVVLADPATLSSGFAVSSVMDHSLKVGEATVQRGGQNPAAAEFAPSGRLSLSLRKGVLDGSGEGMGDRFDASFVGPVGVLCYVPSSAIGGGVGAPVVEGSGGAQVLVEDRAQQSELCKTFLAGPLAGR